MNPSCYLVAGLGKTGHSIASYLKRNNRPFVVFDTRKTVEGLDAFKQSFPGVEIFLGELPASVYPNLKEIITSPGISLEEPFLQRAKQLGIPVIGDIECLAREISAPVIAITGTNGKSTVTTLVGEMAKVAGMKVAVAGNIGTPVLDLLADDQSYDVWVLELSSFQLDLIESLQPLAATILNISPDHLDRHHDLGAYTAAKQRIYRQAKFCIYNRDDAATRPLNDVSTMTTSFGLDNPHNHIAWGIDAQPDQAYLVCGDQHLVPVSDMLIKGKQNWQNALAACALADTLGIERRHQIQVLKTFSGLPHRCQHVRNIEQVDWINDSKGTNIGATISAVSGIGGSIAGKIVLIAGGLGKGADFTQLRPVIADYARCVIVIGKDANKIADSLQDIMRIIRAANFEEAIQFAKQEAQTSDVVLLSPACASQDMFRDFNHRGEEFARLVGQL